jgi:hypothetical protein
LLPVVALCASDDQSLFELNVRLQYSDDERLLLPALLELAGAAGLDMPAEALLQRQSILVSTCCQSLQSMRLASREVRSGCYDHWPSSAMLKLASGSSSIAFLFAGEAKQQYQKHVLCCLAVLPHTNLSLLHCCYTCAPDAALAGQLPRTAIQQQEQQGSAASRCCSAAAASDRPQGFSGASQSP